MDIRQQYKQAYRVARSNAKNHYSMWKPIPYVAGRRVQTDYTYHSGWVNPDRMVAFVGKLIAYRLRKRRSP